MFIILSVKVYCGITQLWEFLQLLLNDTSGVYHDIIRWQDKFTGVFKIMDTAKLSELWGQHKNSVSMTYDKLSRALRNYYKTNKLKKIPGQRQVYQFIFSEKNPPPGPNLKIGHLDKSNKFEENVNQENLRIVHKNLQTLFACKNQQIFGKFGKKFESGGI